MKKKAVPEPVHEELLTVTEAAAVLRCHPNTLRAWARQGRLAPVKMGAEQVPMFRKAEVTALMTPLEQAGVIVRDDRHAFPVVGIGASAGGLDALSRMLGHLHTELGLAYVFISHLEHDQEKVLADLLRKKTSMPVIVAENGMRLDPDRLYLGPAATHLSIVNGTITLQKPAGRGDTVHRPIDAFFSAMAAEYQNNAIGILLSGGGMDGTAGLRAIKAEDGLTIVQDSSAQDASMPQSAVDAGVVDQVLAPEAIGKALSALVKQLYLGGKATIPGKHENELRRILEYLEEQRGVDFTQYKENTIHRRIIRRMVLSKSARLSDYSTLLHGTPSELDTLFNDLLINVTSFFRDPLFFKALTKRILPALFKDRMANEPLRIWVPACAGGEEVVSVAITLLEFLGDRSLTTPVQIFATDLNERTIEKARLGIYKKSSLQNLTPARVKQFFTHVDGHFQVIKSIRDMCVFAKHDLLKDPPFSHVDLISCQNVLIYLENAAQGRILRSFHYAMKPNGFLVVGRSETTGNAGEIFLQPDREFKYYTKKRKASERLELGVGYKPSPVPQGLALPGLHAAPTVVSGTDLDRDTDKLLLQRFVPPSVLVNRDLEIVRFRGVTAPYLGPTTGKASLNLLKMVRDDLAFELRTLLHKARKEKVGVRKSGIPIRLNDGLRDVGIEVVPIGGPRDPHYLVLFKDEGSGASEAGGSNGKPAGKPHDARDKRIALLEQELRDAREQVRVISEESEIATQELQSANEEVVSSNEELQSINEELETSKEELQSINEEFATINEELQTRNDALRESEERLMLATRTGKVGIWDWDVVADRIEWSEALYEIHGVSRETFDASVNGFSRLIHAEDRERVKLAIENAIKNDHRYELEFRAVRPDGKVIWLFTNATIVRAGTRALRMLGATLEITDRKVAENALKQRTRTLELMNAVGDSLIAELDTEKIVQAVTDTGREVTGAAFGAFFYNVVNEQGDSYTLYTLSGASREAFAKFPMPRATALFGPTFRGEGAVRVADVLKDPRYGKMAPHQGMPKGHLPVRSYLAVPVTSRDGKVLGGLFYGHPEPDRFTREGEEALSALAAQAALAIDNANLHAALQRELEQQRLAQLALGQSEERFRLLADNMDQLAWMADPDGSTPWFNHRWEEFSGIPVGEIRARAASELHHPDHYERVTASLRASAEKGESWEGTFPLKGRDGKWHWFLSRVMPHKDEEGKIHRWFGTSTDVSELREAEEQLRESEERFRLLGDHMPQLAWISGADGVPVWYNKQWEIYTGVDMLNATREERKHVMHPEHTDRVRTSHERGVAAGLPWEDSFPLRGTDGQFRWFLSRSVPVRDANGAIIRWFGTNTDITASKQAEDRIREREARLIMAAEAAQLGIFEWRIQEDVSYWENMRMYEIFGRTREDGALPNAEFFGEVLHPDEVDGFQRAMQQAIASHGTFQLTFHIQRKSDGSQRTIDIACRVEDGPDGTARSLVGVMADITEREAGSEALRRLAAIVESSLDAIISKDLNGIITSWNHGAQRVFGYRANEAIGRSITMLIPEDRHQEERTILGRIRSGENIEHYVTVRRRKDGTLIDVSLSVSPIRNEAGTVVGASKIARDISESKRMEDAIHAANQQLQMVTDKMPVAVARCSRDQKYIWASQGYNDWIDLPSAAIVGKPIAEVIGKAAYAAIKPHIEQVLAGKRVEYEARLELPTRGARWINAIYAPIYEEGTQPEGWIAVITDITRRKQLEAALQDADQHKDHFLATLAHELRNPLAPLKNGIELLEFGANDPELNRSTQAMMARQLDHMVRLVDDLMDLSRISRGKIELRMERVDLSGILATAIETSEPLLKERQHQLHVDIPEGEWPVNGDADRLTQVVSNLLNNSAKYTDPGGRIDLILERAGNEALIRVKDNGIGIEPTMLPRVFDMFAQMAPAQMTRVGGGLGIGLNIVKRLVEMHDGHVMGQSEGEGRGSEFIVRLPLTKNMAKPAPMPMKADMNATQGRRVLVVDDNADAALSMSLILKKRGHEVEVALDGEEAITRVSAFHPNVVFMDIGMPRMNGYDACTRIRALPEGKDITIVALSGWGQEEDRKRSGEAGFDRHLVKPIDSATVIDLVANSPDSSTSGQTATTFAT